MTRWRTGFLLILFFLTTSIYAQTVEERHVIVTTTPSAKETIATPSGYVDCYTIEGGWYNNTWIPSHRFCQYENSAEGVVWVEGYWACTKYIAKTGACTNWDWKPGRWEKSFKFY